MDLRLVSFLFVSSSSLVLFNPSVTGGTSRGAIQPRIWLMATGRHGQAGHSCSRITITGVAHVALPTTPLAVGEEGKCGGGSIDIDSINAQLDAADLRSYCHAGTVQPVFTGRPPHSAPFDPGICMPIWLGTYLPVAGLCSAFPYASCSTKFLGRALLSLINLVRACPAC